MKISPNLRQYEGFNKLVMVNEILESNDLDYNQSRIKPLKDKPSKRIRLSLELLNFLILLHAGWSSNWFTELNDFDIKPHCDRKFINFWRGFCICLCPS
jgi:hypothetical protein